MRKNHKSFTIEPYETYTLTYNIGSFRQRLVRPVYNNKIFD